MSRQIVCQNCNSKVSDGSKYCSQCGHLLPTSKKTHCNQCGRALKGDEKFCPHCGTELDSSATKKTVNAKKQLRVVPEEVYCKKCDYFRRAIPLSSKLGPGGSKQVNEALLKIQEEEKKQKKSEAQHKVGMIKMEMQSWGFRPLMSDYCAAKAASDDFEIRELKNRNNDCPDFSEKKAKKARCDTCIHRIEFEDPYTRLYGITDTETHRKILEGINSQWANEMTTIFFNKGSFPEIPKFHEHCWHYSNGSRYMALPYPNVQSDCLFHEPKKQFSGSFLGKHGKKS